MIAPTSLVLLPACFPWPPLRLAEALRRNVHPLKMRNRKRIRQAKHVHVLHIKNVLSTQMLEVSRLQVGTMIRLEKDAWSTVKLLRQATTEYAPPPLMSALPHFARMIPASTSSNVCRGCAGSRSGLSIGNAAGGTKRGARGRTRGVHTGCRSGSIMQRGGWCLFGFVLNLRLC